METSKKKQTQKQKILLTIISRGFETPLQTLTVHSVRSKGKILLNFEAFSEYTNFNTVNKMKKLMEAIRVEP